MARKPKQAPLVEEVLSQKEVKTEFVVTEKIEGSINNKKYSANVGDKVQFDKFEAYVFKNHIKEA
jgi:hypothetical protein